MKQSKKFNPLNYTEPISKIYLVRHGETEGNRKNLIIGTWDLKLNRTGQKQAKKAAERLAEITKKQSLNFIICSPLKRTRETAKVISKRTKIKKIFLNKNLIERSEGKWQKKSYWDIRDIDPKNFKNWIKDLYNTRPPKGESIVDLKRRISKFYKRILSKYLGKNFIVVAHSGSIKMLIMLALGLDINRFWHLRVDCGSISELHLSKKHCMLRLLNQH